MGRGGAVAAAGMAETAEGEGLSESGYRESKAGSEAFAAASTEVRNSLSARHKPSSQTAWLDTDGQVATAFCGPHNFDDGG